MKLTFFGHAAFQIETGSTTILVDPFITGNRLAESVTSADALDPDVILLTHAHGDHWGDTPSIAKRTGALVISNHEIGQYLTGRHGHDNVFTMNSGGAAEFDWGRVRQTYARHSSSFPDGTYGGNPNGYLLHLDGACIYAAGDTCPFAEMEWIGQDNDISVALLPVGSVFTMCPETSLRAIRMLDPAVTVPIHYDTFPAIEVDIEAWADSVRAAGFTPKVLKPGDSMTVEAD